MPPDPPRRAQKIFVGAARLKKIFGPASHPDKILDQRLALYSFWSRDSNEIEQQVRIIEMVII